jgi:hypothetical protein
MRSGDHSASDSPVAPPQRPHCHNDFDVTSTNDMTVPACAGTISHSPLWPLPPAASQSIDSQSHKRYQRI